MARVWHAFGTLCARVLHKSAHTNEFGTSFARTARVFHEFGTNFARILHEFGTNFAWFLHAFFTSFALGMHVL